uniref:Glycine cleavage system H protein n=1 Tax=Timema bartmani TaxID=61472 RepID=A0A7R9F356_9NEOP|nr:unnamed protein product [Timema bartmani]
MVLCCRMVAKTRQVTGISFQFLNSLQQHSGKVHCTTLKYIRSIGTTKCLGAFKYSDKHEWVKMEGNVGTIGITHYAQDALGDVVFAQLPDVGTIIGSKDECGALESVKAASELFSPVSGKVVEKNSAVEESPGLINQSCYDKGWLFKLELVDASELEKLMDEKTYEDFCKTDTH